MSISEQHRIDLLTNSCREDVIKQMSHALINAAFLGGLFRSCLNCANWIDNPHGSDAVREVCGLYKIKPPAKVIVTGCDSHTDNIPY